MTDQPTLPGTSTRSTRRRRGKTRAAVEKRLRDLPDLDAARRSLLLHLADAVDDERHRTETTPDVSRGTLGRLLVELSAMLDRWDAARSTDVDDLDLDGDLDDVDLDG